MAPAANVFVPIREGGEGVLVAPLFVEGDADAGQELFLE